MKKHSHPYDDNTAQRAAIRPLARRAARELSPEEVAMVAGGRSENTTATGPNGDDPADPGNI